MTCIDGEMQNIIDMKAQRRYNQGEARAKAVIRLKIRKRTAIIQGIAPRKGRAKEATRMDGVLLGDLVQMRKTHPCGSDRWTVIRVGADIKIRCMGCSRIVMMDRADFNKRMKKVLSHATEPIRGTNETDDI